MLRQTSVLKRTWHSCTRPAASAPLACSKTSLVSRGPRVDDLGGAVVCSCRGPVVCARVPESLYRSPPSTHHRFVPGAGRHPGQWQDATQSGASSGSRALIRLTVGLYKMARCEEVSGGVGVSQMLCGRGT